MSEPSDVVMVMEMLLGHCVVEAARVVGTQPRRLPPNLLTAIRHLAEGIVNNPAWRDRSFDVDFRLDPIANGEIEADLSQPPVWELKFSVPRMPAEIKCDPHRLLGHFFLAFASRV